MITAQDYLNNTEGLDKEAVIANVIGKGVRALFGGRAGAVSRLGARKAGKAIDAAKGMGKDLHKGYKTTGTYKNYGNKPLYAAGGAGAFIAGRATGDSNINIRI